MATTITLTAGEQYVLAAYRPNSNDLFPWFSSGQATVDTNFTLLDDLYEISGEFNFPTQSERRLAIVGANLQYSAVPEPAEYAAVTGLALGVFALVQRRRQAAGR